ncbi:hypothetical protein ACQ86O_08135 [Serratia sp. L9]|uniref:hypothetical protein n=1 Tax=Serratia sp. L9 TaxID=3423946 RepID=UPI003D67A784
MVNSDRFTPPEQSTPNTTNQHPGEAESRHDQHQWIVRSFNEMKEDNRHVNTRIDQVYDHLSDVKNDASLACAISRMEVTLSNNVTKLDDVNRTLSGHTQQLGKLTGIESKLDKLESIESAISKVKIAVGIGSVIIAGAIGIVWFLFGAYLSKILEALNALVLK